MEPTSEIIQEHLYLVDRGVRALALIGHCEAEKDTMFRIYSILDCESRHGSIPFVIDRGDGLADFGYGSAAWTVDLYRWAVTENGSVPDRQRSRILGLLLGYSIDSIARFEEAQSGRFFDAAVSTSAAPVAT